MRVRLLFLQAAILLLTFVLYKYLGLDRMYFWTYWWFDIPMHVLGGMWAALFCAWAASTVLDIRLSFAQYVLGALVIGIGWEVFEYVLGVGGSVFMNYPLDTAKDILDDGIGGALAYALVRLLRI